MARYSPQTLAVFTVLLGSPQTWHHGYDLAKQTGLKSGTLYPILLRLADRSLVEARWEEDQPTGRPRRHLYRLTASGASTARTAVAEARKATTPSRVRGPAVAG